MAIFEYVGKKPRLGRACFVAENATIAGDVTLGDECSVWFGASLRAEVERIEVGARSNIQDNAVLHADSGFPCVVGEGVTIGHGVILHGSTVGSNCLIGMGSILLNGCVVQRDCLVGAGSLLTQGFAAPEGSLVVGSPAVVKRKLSKEEIEKIREGARHYLEFRAHYL